tara:strand:+ start:207 stop:518 length:312 start_codon:yes stop_codon:yes gene_type:complete
MNEDFKLDDELNYDITNHMKFYWYDTDAYKFSGDDNEGYVYGILSWYGQYNDVDTVAEHYNDDGTDTDWEWFKTKQERDKEFNDLTGRKFERFSTTPLKESDK